MDVVDEQIDVTSRGVPRPDAWCAPAATTTSSTRSRPKDYYALAGIFGSTEMLFGGGGGKGGKARPAPAACTRSATAARRWASREGTAGRLPASASAASRPSAARRVPRGFLTRRRRSASRRRSTARQRPARAGRVAAPPRQPADGPRDGQSRLAAPVRPGPRRDRRTTSAAAARRRAIRSCSTTWPSQFVDDGWSVKKLIRDIVLSRAYQLASAPRRRQLRGRSGQRAALADEPAPARRRGDPRRHAGRQRQARPDAAEGLAGHRRRRQGQGKPAAASAEDATTAASTCGIVRGAAAGSAGAVRRRRPEPGRRPARGDDRAGPGAVPDEQPVRRRAGEGARRSGCWPPRTATTPAASTWRIALACARPADAERERAEAPERTSQQDRRASRHGAWAGFCQALFATAEFRYLRLTTVPAASRRIASSQRERDCNH